MQNENSLEYFVAKELDNGIPIVLSMISEGHPFGDNKYAEELKQRAQDLLAKGPAPLDKTEINRNRYAITDLIDDIPARNEYELLGTLAVLHQRLGDFYLRSNGQWSGNRKALHRAIKKYNPDFAQKYGDAFEAAFKQNNFFQLERLVGKILLPFGGRLVVSEKDYASDKANQPKSNTGK
ncbi:MAG: hypothetical protein LBJ18_01755 [Rickettsiales bacterium]|nr:hypothetical protein [Rickettsiales bacterium]